MKNILFIHQSAELYGSDKTLLYLVVNLDKNKFYPIVILPNDGPLKKELEKENIKVIITPVLKLHRKMFTPSNLLQFINDFFKGIKTIKSIKKQHKIDFIYSNTLAVLLGFFYCFFHKTKHIWHVHEIIESPKIFAKLFRLLLNNSTNTFVIHNSIATSNFWNCKGKNVVIWNGIDTFPELKNEEKDTIRRIILNTDSELVLALVGRISRWKGQMLLLEVFNELIQTHQNIKLVYIGSTPPNQEHFLSSLNDKIGEYNLIKKVEIIPFQENINQLWQSIDVAIVPSTEPEPFGMVAIEAMMAQKPVVAANHGGLTEIVVNNQTGFLVEPNNKTALKEALEKLIYNPELRKTFGEQGYQRAVESFSIQNYVTKIEDILENN
ncbi:glycosyltransferase family 4 protein [Flavobacterium difficile]|uniref:Glycosyltransferase family 4 protein n=1 Tax=Flavobacterium difficile TaxID=2709659 RepID=A0ABX0I7Z4_9FLAO|nr:glycosyltransferase family 4 protein [Flavobacterium difficile]NHM02732.1 glycosyltransferase family 4 protein [Flavobacterium difficile]